MADNQQINAANELNTSMDELYSAVRAVNLELQGITTTIGKNNAITKEAAAAYKKIVADTRKLVDDEEKISKLSRAELTRLKTRVSSNVKLLKTAAKEVDTRGKLSESAQALLDASNEQFNLEKLLIAKIEERTKKEFTYESALGLTGATLENLNRIGIRAFGGFGLNLGAFSAGFAEARASVEETADAIADATDPGKPATFNQKLKVLKAGLPGIGKAFKEGLNDPASVLLLTIKLVGKSFLAVQNEVVQLGRLTGQVGTAFATFNMNVASTVDVLKVANELTLALGRNAQNAFSSSTLAAAAEFKNTLGLSGAEVGNLALLTEATGANLENNLEAAVDSVSAFNQLNRTAISQGVVLRDISNISEDIAASYGGQTKALAQAAASARRLGLELQRVDKIADSLLQFESSIEAELEAQLLTGRDINLAKARELALSNDLAGVGEEIFKNSASIAEFGQMGRIAQEAQAQALGLSRQELGRIAFLRALDQKLTAKQAADAAGVSLADMQRMTVQEQFNKAIEKATQLLAPLVSMFDFLVSNSFIFYATLTAIGAFSFVRLLAGLVPVITALAAGAVSAATIAGFATAGAALIMIPLIVSMLTSGQQEAARIPQVGDMIKSPGGPILASEKGTVQLDKNDTIVAGTNLGGKGNRSLERKLDELISIIKEGGNVYMDTNKVGQALVLGGYKLG